MFAELDTDGDGAGAWGDLGVADAGDVGAEVALEGPGRHGHRDRNHASIGLQTFGKGELEFDGLPVAVRVAREITHVVDHGEEQAEADQTGPDVIEHDGSVVSRSE